MLKIYKSVLSKLEENMYTLVNYQNINRYVTNAIDIIGKKSSLSKDMISFQEKILELQDTLDSIEYKNLSDKQKNNLHKNFSQLTRYSDRVFDLENILKEIETSNSKKWKHHIYFFERAIDEHLSYLQDYLKKFLS